MDKLSMEQLFDNVIAGAAVARPITYWHFLESLKANNLSIINTEGLEERVTVIKTMLSALEGVLPFMEEVEEKLLVGDEGCLWPVEAVRVAIDDARAALKAIGGE